MTSGSLGVFLLLAVVCIVVGGLVALFVMRKKAGEQKGEAQLEQAAGPALDHLLHSFQMLRQALEHNTNATAQNTLANKGGVYTYTTTETTVEPNPAAPALPDAETSSTQAAPAGAIPAAPDVGGGTDHMAALNAEIATLAEEAVKLDTKLDKLKAAQAALREALAS